MTSIDRNGITGMLTLAMTDLCSMCSNPSKSSEKMGKCHRLNPANCRHFASSRKPQQPIALRLHGRGRWFDRASPTRDCNIAFWAAPQVVLAPT
jgi:hypothetical protein